MKIKNGTFVLRPGVTKIGARAFYGCTGLTSIPTGVTKIGACAFSGCTGLTSIPTGVTEIGDWAFSGCTGLTSIPPGVTKIGAGAFEGCTGLQLPVIRGYVAHTFSANGNLQIGCENHPVEFWRENFEGIVKKYSGNGSEQTELRKIINHSCAARKNQI
jgi:hypothetical protein